MKGPLLSKPLLVAGAGTILFLSTGMIDVVLRIYPEFDFLFLNPVLTIFDLWFFQLSYPAWTGSGGEDGDEFFLEISHFTRRGLVLALSYS